MIDKPEELEVTLRFKLEHPFGSEANNCVRLFADVRGETLDLGHSMFMASEPLVGNVMMLLNYTITPELLTEVLRPWLPEAAEESKAS